MLTLTDMKHLSRLARLAPSDERLMQYAPMCDNILQYMDVLAEVDTTGIEPTYSPVQHACAMRADEPQKRREREEVLANAPETDGKFFIVPRIV